MLDNLLVIHKLKAVPAAAINSSAELPLAFLTIDTCQRVLAIGHRAVERFYQFDSSWEIYYGVDAYRFLLSVGCGLESEMIGETEVLGQIKTAWNLYTQLHSSSAVNNISFPGDTPSFLRTVFSRYFEDIKDIRSRHLQNLGQSSYGSLLRKILNERQISGRILVVGAGEFAQAVLPWLAKFQVTLTNRTANKALALQEKLAEKAIAIETADFQNSDWTQWDHLVMLVPANQELQSRINAWSEAKPQGIFIDLAEPAWPALANSTITLQDLYRFKKLQDSHRAQETGKARKACLEKAHLRDTQMVLTLTHGWEDLWSYQHAPF